MYDMDTLDACPSSPEVDCLVDLCAFLRLFFFYIMGIVRMTEVGIIKTTKSELTGGEGL
jgi:hypothetical protein